MVVGGCFAHALFEVAVTQAVASPEFEKRCMEEWQKPQAEVLGLITYKLRVMCSHVRLVFDCCSTDRQAHPLGELFMKMSEPKDEHGSNMRRQRRAERLSKRQNPFICFRSTEDTEGSEKVEEAKVITKHYDGKVATMLMSDGVVINADLYEPGPDGLVVAKWLHNNDMMHLEIPNARCQNGVLLPLPPPPVRRSTKKRPAAEMAAGSIKDKAPQS